MRHKTTIPIAALVLMGGQFTGRAFVAAQGAATKADQMTERQIGQALKTAPDTQVFEFRGGTKMTAAEMKAKVQKLRSTYGIAPKSGPDAAAQAKFKVAEAKFLADQKAALDAANAKVTAALNTSRK